MLNNSYNKNSLEAVTQGSRVSGHPNRVSFHSVKTTLFLLLVLLNITFAEDLSCDVKMVVNKFNEEPPAEISITRLNQTSNLKSRSQGFESATEAEIRVLKQTEEAKDVALNKAEIREGKYWIDGRWVIRKNSRYERVEGGWIYHEEESNTEDIDKTIIRKGNNLVTFKMDGCEAGFKFDMFKGSYKGIGIGVISIPKEKLKELMNTSLQ
jgi:hypothetical protein